MLPKTYVHRVGRSARAGRFGEAVTFVTKHDLLLLRAIEEEVGKKLEELPVNHKEVTLYAGRVLASKREAEIKLDRQGIDEKEERYKRKELQLAGLSDGEVDAAMEGLRGR